MKNEPIEKAESGPKVLDKNLSAGVQPEKSPRKALWIILLPLVILLIGSGLALYIAQTAPEPRKVAPRKDISQVQVQEVRLKNEKVTVSAMGTVIPARRLDLKARVSGEILSVHPEFTDGGFIRKGETILQVDSADYELAVAKQQSNVVNARYQFKLELGHQDVASKEWELLNGDKPASDFDRELALRKPHLDKARADVAAAEAELKRARLDLTRTRITVPFNVIVISRNVEIGSQVSTQETLAELVGTDDYWVQVSMPIDRIGWFSIPIKKGEKGALVRIDLGNQQPLDGHVVKLLGDLESEGRMARVLVAVRDPLGLAAKKKDHNPLLLGQYVRVEIEGMGLENVARISRAALRGSNQVWIVDQDDKLQVREVDVAWREEKTLLLRRGLRDGDRLIVSELADPEEGMSVQVISPSSARLISEKGLSGANHGS